MNNLDIAFEKSGKTQSSIADAVGINFTTVCRAIHDPWRVSWPTFRKVALAVGLTDPAAREMWVSSKKLRDVELSEKRWEKCLENSG